MDRIDATHRALRISVLLPDLRPGGAEKLHVLLAEEWLHSGHQVEFVLRRAVGALLADLPKGVSVVDLKAPRVRNSAFALARYLRRSQPDVLLTAMWPLTVVSIVAAKMAGYRGKIVVSDHSPLSMAYSGKGWLHRSILKASIKRLYPMASARVAVTDGVADDLTALSGLAIESFTVIHNPVRVDRGALPVEMPALLESREKPVVLTVGTLKRVKRHDLLIEAFQLLSSAHKGTLCIVGDGPERAALEAQVVDAGLSEQVLFAGHVSDPAPWYEHSDVFVLASSYEGFGNVLVEAMGRGLAIVSTDCPVGPREVLAGGRYGRLVPPGDAGALANAINEVLELRPDPWPGILWAQKFSPEVIAAQYISMMSGRPTNSRTAGDGAADQP